MLQTPFPGRDAQTIFQFIHSTNRAGNASARLLRKGAWVPAHHHAGCRRRRPDTTVNVHILKTFVVASPAPTLRPPAPETAASGPPSYLASSITPWSCDFFPERCSHHVSMRFFQLREKFSWAPLALLIA